MSRYFCFISFVLFFTACPALAQTVVYTTPDYPVKEPEPGTVVQVLEDVAQLERSLFSPLSAHPQQAEQQARQRMQQPDWKSQEARLTRAYQALLDARASGITKVPAVVFDNQLVVYGTTDAALAQEKRDAWQERQP